MWLLPAGIALAGVGIALAAVSPTYPLLLLAVLVSGLGVAAFHPEGMKFASFVSGSRRASGMAVFSVGGNLGFALGPDCRVLPHPRPRPRGRSPDGHSGNRGRRPSPARRRATFAGSCRPGGRRLWHDEETDRPRAFALLLGVIALRSIAALRAVHVRAALGGLPGRERPVGNAAAVALSPRTVRSARCSAGRSPTASGASR